MRWREDESTEACRKWLPDTTLNHPYRVGVLLHLQVIMRVDPQDAEMSPRDVQMTWQ